MNLKIPSLLLAVGFQLVGSPPAAVAGSPVVRSQPVEEKEMKEAIQVPRQETGWKLSVGAQWRQLGNADWHTGSLAARANLPWLAGGAAGSGQGASIPAGQGDHLYDDGYVREDISGGAGVNTWFWGYNNQSQLQGNNLSFHSATGGGSIVSGSRSSGSSLSHGGWSDELDAGGFHAELESPAIFHLGAAAITIQLGYSWAQDDRSHRTANVFRAWQQGGTSTQSVGLVDVYDVTGVVVPNAPFAGTFAGPGVLIPDAPASRTLVPGAGTSSAQSAMLYSSVTESLRVNLHTISIGPNLSMQCCQRVRLGLGFGFGLNIVDYDAQYGEKLYAGRRKLRSFQAGASGTELLPGVYVEPSMEFSLTQHLALSVSGRYDWVQDFHEKVGPSSFDFSPGGWSVRGGLTYSF